MREGARRFAFLGDLVGYGAEPAEVLAIVRAMAGEGAVVLRGNHDAIAAAGEAGRTHAHAGSAWTHARLPPSDREFLAGRPLEHVEDGLLLVHASADDPGAWHYVEHARRAEASLAAAAARHGVHRVAGGHVHEQRLFYVAAGGRCMDFEPVPGVPVPVGLRRGWVATVGSVGQPRDGDPRAMYALWEPAPAERMTFHRVAYDHVSAAQAVRASGLPADYADRLLEAR